MDCSTVLPVSSFYSTNLNNKICSYDRLAQRISRTLGAPLINIEVHQDQLYENIGIASEMFTKFAGYTREYVIFDSEPNFSSNSSLVITPEGVVNDSR
jgi:hypothetical protein